MIVIKGYGYQTLYFLKIEGMAGPSISHTRKHAKLTKMVRDKEVSSCPTSIFSALCGDLSLYSTLCFPFRLAALQLCLVHCHLFSVRPFMDS